MQAIATWVATKVVVAASAAGVSGTALSVVGVTAFYGTQLAIAAAAAAAARSLAGTPDIETAKGTLKQPMPPRIRGYGRRRLGGSFLLWEAQKNYAYDVVAVHHGRIEAVEQVWLHDNVLSFVGGGTSGWVQGSPVYGGGDNDLIHIETRLGAETETAYSAIVAALGPSGIWTEDCRGDGIATIGADYHHAKKENLLADFPNGNTPQWGITGRLSPVWDPRDPAQSRTDPSTWTASANLALQLLDFMWNAPGGMRVDYEAEIAPQLAGWKEEADICDEAVPLKAGGTEPRYWGSGFYALPGDPQDTLDKMLAACDGRVLRDEFGVWRLWVGKVRGPTVWLTDEDIADYDVQGDAAAFDVANEIVPTFVSEAHGWSMIEATPWRVEAEVLARGAAHTTPLPLEWCNSASMSRRLAKREWFRQQAEIRGTLVGRLSAARALGHRWIGVSCADLELENAWLEVQKGGRISFARAAVDLPFSLVDPAVDAWDAATEEDASGTAPDRPDVGTFDPPVLTSATPFAESLGGAEGVRLALVGSGPDREDLTWYVRTRATGDDTFQVTQVTDEAPGTPFEGESGFVPAVASLEVGIGYETGGSTLRWSAALTIDTTLPTSQPAPTLFSAGGTAGVVSLSARTPVNPEAAEVEFLSTSGATFASPTLRATAPVTALGAIVEAEATLSGANYWWARAVHEDGVTKSDPVGPIQVVETMSPPTGLSIVSGGGRTIHWTTPDVPNFDHVKLFWKAATGDHLFAGSTYLSAAGALAEAPNTADSYYWSAGGTYDIWVVAYNADETASAVSATYVTG